MPTAQYRTVPAEPSAAGGSPGADHRGTPVDAFGAAAVSVRKLVGGAKHSGRRLALALVAAFMASPFQAWAQGTLQGDQKLACEAILCLAASKRPHECEPSIRRYFSINAKKLSVRKSNRASFLKLCPKQSDADVQKIVDANNADALLPDDQQPTPPGSGSARAQLEAAIARTRQELAAANARTGAAASVYAVCVTRMGDANDCQSELNAMFTARAGEQDVFDRLQAQLRLLAAMP